MDPTATDAARLKSASMGPTSSRWLRRSSSGSHTLAAFFACSIGVGVLIFLSTALLAAVEGTPGGTFIFRATSGEDGVLLTWSGADRPSPYGAFLLLRREAAEVSFTGVGPEPIVPLTDPNAIEALFPAGSAIRVEASRDLVPDLGATLGEALLALRASTDPGRIMQRQMLIAQNHGVAAAEGMAWLDSGAIADSRYLYELWGASDPNDHEPAERLGKVWVTAGQVVPLLAPLSLQSVTVPGEPGDVRVFLYWDPTLDPAGRETRATSASYHIYRLAGGTDPNDAIPDPVVPIDDPNSGAVRINPYPVVPNPGTDPDQPDFFFVDGTAEDPNSPPITRGTSYKYWAVARDPLGRHGLFSAPVQVCVRDRSRPRQVMGVRTTMVEGPTAGVELRWTPNASDPNTIGGGTPYVDDTVAYNVYRFTDFNEAANPPDTSLPVAANLPNTSWLDEEPGMASNRKRLYWYVVTAVDQAVCNEPPNESEWSAPHRGIFYDITAPTIARAEPYCNSMQNPACIRDCGPACSPSDPNCNPDTNPTFTWCQCGGASGIFPVVGDDWGYRVPSSLVDSDTWTLRLYRGAKGTDFRPVEESVLVTDLVGGVPWTGYKTAETFASSVSQKIAYRLRALDRDANVGPSVSPKGSYAQPIPAFVRGGPPPAPVVLGSDFAPAGGGTLEVRWHAPGAETLAGFIVRLGPEADQNAGTFAYLPPGNFHSETDIDPAVMRDPGHCDKDFDNDGSLDPRTILVTDATQCIADLVAADADLGGLKDPNTPIYQHTFAPVVLALDTVVEIRSVDIAGQISAPARWSHLRPDTDAADFAPAWVDRPSPNEGYSLAAYREPGTDFVTLCWDQEQTIGVDPPMNAGDPSGVAVFRALVEAAGARGYQQRSPLLDIDAYNAAGLDPVPNCTHCQVLLPTTTDVACWQDRATACGTTWRYSVVGLGANREIQAVFGPSTVTTGACP